MGKTTRSAASAPAAANKLNWLHPSVDFATLKPVKGFLTNEDTFGRQPVTGAIGYESGYSRIITPEKNFMINSGVLKEAGFPQEAFEGKVEISATKGVIKVHAL